MKRASIGIGSHRRLALSEKRLPYLLTLPSLLTIFGVLIIPILYSLFLSVHNLVLSSRTYEFVGLKHYIAMFSDKSFLNSIWQTLVFTVLSVAAEMVLGVGVALVLNQEFKGRGFVRGLMILPWALPGVVNAIMWQWIFKLRRVQRAPDAAGRDRQLSGLAGKADLRLYLCLGGQCLEGDPLCGVADHRSAGQYLQRSL